MHLRSKRIYRVKNAVVFRGVEQRSQRSVFEKLVPDMQLQSRMDCQQTFCKDLRLRSSDGFCCCDNLPVPVGVLHHIAVHDGQLADCGPCQKLRRDPPDPAEPDAQDMGRFQTLQSFRPQQKLRPRLPRIPCHFPKTRLKFSAICSFSVSTSQSRSSAATL